ncbi:MAG TPA: amidohydrolase family protein, partial [Caldilinea sp.]|nr:amidohydrolase family protein [Caldilinea sp.]
MKAIIGGRVLTITAGDMEQGVVLVEQGRFQAVGRDVDIPPGAEVIDAAGKYVVPGLIDAHTHIGLSDFSETTSPFTPQVQILDSIDLGSPG